MELSDITTIRLYTQQIAATKFKTAKEIVGWLGAVQAQDYAMAKWAIGMRLPGATEKKIDAEIEKGKIIRTHLLRPTWHFVTPENVYWMLDLSAAKIKAQMRSNDKKLGLTEAIFKKSNAV